MVARDRTFTQPLNWTIAFFLGLCHVGAVAALFFFTWKGLALFLFLWWLSGSLGIGMATTACSRTADTSVQSGWSIS